MRSFFAIATIVALLPTVLGAPAELKPISRVSGAKKPNSYLVTLKKGTSHSRVASLKLKKTPTIFENFNSFAAELDEEDLNVVRAHPDVELIEEDGIMSIVATQTNAPWGLGRISQNGILSTRNAAALTYTYRTTDPYCGSGVDVYVVDTGIVTTHNEFGGRARWGATFGGYANADGHGHGTHCAGTVGGSQFGVAKCVSLIAVKVLSDAGSGATSDIVNGMNWVLTQSRSTGRPSVISMSLGGSGNTAMDNAVATCTSGGVHVVVAAGNSAANVSGFSPARAPSAITVAASDVNDAFASFSNYGSGVDIIAPGVAVISAYKGSNSATASLSGTSMATPHTAGYAAYYISKNGNSSPSALASSIIAGAVSNAISGVPSGTPNRFLNNEF